MAYCTASPWFVIAHQHYCSVHWRYSRKAIVSSASCNWTVMYSAGLTYMHWNAEHGYQRFRYQFRNHNWTVLHGSMPMFSYRSSLLHYSRNTRSLVSENDIIIQPCGYSHYSEAGLKGNMCFKAKDPNLLTHSVCCTELWMIWSIKNRWHL